MRQSCMWQLIETQARLWRRASPAKFGEWPASELEIRTASDEDEKGPVCNIPGKAARRRKRRGEEPLSREQLY